MPDKKKKEEEIPILKEQEELRKIIQKYSAEKKKPELAESKMKFVTKEFQEFQSEYFAAEKPKTTFERFARSAGRLLKISVKKEDKEKIDEALYYSGLVVKAEDVVALSILAFILALISAGPLFLLGSFNFALPAIIIGVVGLFVIQKYPTYLQNIATIETLNSMPLAVTYMVIYMRSSPTLEGAVGFAAEHVGGSLGRDLKKLVWDLQNGFYRNMDDALTDYSAKWQKKNPYFSTSIELLRDSMRISDENERLRTLDEAARVVLRGNLDMMKGFARGLRLPITVLYMLGIVLPVMGLVIAPVITTLMAQGLSAQGLIVVYNIILPIVIYAMMKVVLSKRPGGFTRPDISDYPGLPLPGHLIKISKSGRESQIPLMPISILAFILISIPGIFMLLNPPAEVGFSLLRIFQSVSFVVAASVAIIIYTYGSSYQKLKVRSDIEEIENGLDSALYELGERIAMGNPLETAVRTSAETTKSGAMRGLFLRISTTMKTVGATLEQALFDEEYGALRFYPSKMLRTIMEVTVESTHKGIETGAQSLRTISKFLQNLRIVKNEIQGSIGKTVTNMRFQAQFLTSFIAGVIVALDILLFKILTELGQRIESISLPSDVSVNSVGELFKSSMFNVASVVPAEYMQIIVGVYMIEVSVLLAMMINGVMNGKDEINQNYTIGTTLMASTTVYLVALIFGILLFAGFELG